MNSSMFFSDPACPFVLRESEMSKAIKIILNGRWVLLYIVIHDEYGIGSNVDFPHKSTS